MSMLRCKKRSTMDGSLGAGRGARLGRARGEGRGVALFAACRVGRPPKAAAFTHPTEYTTWTVNLTIHALVLAQWIDRSDAPAYLGLIWGSLVLWFGFLFAARRNGFAETLVKTFFLLPALLAFIWIVWGITGKGESDTGSLLTLFGCIGGSAVVVALLLKRPRTPSDRL
jgi:hypothetical protein